MVMAAPTADAPRSTFEEAIICAAGRKRRRAGRRARVSAGDVERSVKYCSASGAGADWCGIFGVAAEDGGA